MPDHDPYVPAIHHNGFAVTGEPDLDAALAAADCVVVARLVKRAVDTSQCPADLADKATDSLPVSTYTPGFAQKHPISDNQIQKQPT